jgi:hypothetical protein
VLPACSTDGLRAKWKRKGIGPRTGFTQTRDVEHILRKRYARSRKNGMLVNAFASGLRPFDSRPVQAVPATSGTAPRKFTAATAPPYWRRPGDQRPLLAADRQYQRNVAQQRFRQMRQLANKVLLSIQWWAQFTRAA